MTTTSRVGFRCLLPTSSSPMKSQPHVLDVAKFPNTTVLSPPKLRLQAKTTIRASISATSPTGKIGHASLPPALTSTSDPPSIFDGKTRLYISYKCPFAQRAWITRNCKELEEKIELVPIDLQDRPSWYKEKVYPANKVPALEHNNEVKGESLDLIKYIDSNFEGPSLFPDDPAKREFAEEMFTYTGSLGKPLISFFKGEGTEAAAGAVFDDIETSLSKFEDGPFFLGQFSLVDIAFAPFIDIYHQFALDVKKCDFTAGRPKLGAWIEEMYKIEGFNKTRRDRKELIESYKKRFSLQL